MTSESWREFKDRPFYMLAEHSFQQEIPTLKFSHTMPLWMRLDDMLLHEYARICCRPSDHFWRLSFCDLQFAS